jgi:choline dehydrogenase-like flavoprotein
MTPFRDARTIDADTVLTADVCIVGAGAAGITLALDLAGSKHEVILVESGGLDLDPPTQELYQGEVVGHDYPNLASTRLRYFGGSTNHWAGWCAPLDALDFEERDWVPHSGWPLTPEELAPYYERAQRTNQLAAWDYDAESWSTRERPTIDAGADLESVMWQFSPPTRYGEVYREELERARNIRVLLHANLTDLVVTPSADLVEEASFATLEGTAFRVRARYVVIACGGIENARVLLLANGVAPAGLGNDHDLVGRFFMEHPHVTSARCVLSDPSRNVDLYAQRNARRPLGDGVLIARVTDALARRTELVPRAVRARAGLRISDDAQHRGRILNGAAILSEEDPAGRIGTDVLHTISVAAEPEEHEAIGFGIRLQLEQAPNPDSRVTLADDTDALGLRVARLDWRLSELDVRTMTHATEAIGVAFGSSGFGRLRFEEWVLDDPRSWVGMYGGNHHMGTTRMSEDPRRGVVDSDCRVHGVGNLFVAGSSVFPTGGFVNPTLTLTALAHRLADHLRARLGS